jgi:hypothetical protein
MAGDDPAHLALPVIPQNHGATDGIGRAGAPVVDAELVAAELAGTQVLVLPVGCDRPAGFA